MPESALVLQSRWRKRGAALRLLGPAFIASVAYVDPGNFTTNFLAGAQEGYRLLWVVVSADVIAILIQYCSAKLGLITGQNLAELCRGRFNRRITIALWLQAEAVVMATDLAEFVGAAVGLNLVLGIPLFPAGLATGILAFAILGLQERDSRRFLRVVLVLLVLIAAATIWLVLATGHQNGSAAAAGLVPRLSGTAPALAAGIIGATVMPHAVYLHSALTTPTPTPTPTKAVASAERRRHLLRISRWDCVLGLGIAGVMNVLLLCVAAGALRGHPSVDTFDAIFNVLRHAAGPSAALAFGLALLCSGVASSSVGTYAGQVVMAGFTGRRIPLAVRRGVTMLPSLVLLAVAVDPAQALLDSQVVLSFGIPFALVPLLIFSRDRSLLGEHVNRRATTVVLASAITLITALNGYLLVELG